MNKLSLEIHDDVISALKKIKEIDGTSVEVEIPEGAVLLDNVINLKLLEKKAADFNKSLHFHTTDVVGKTVISLLDDDREEMEGMLTKHVNLDELEEVEDITPSTSRFRLPLPSFRLPSFKYILPAVLLLLIGGGVIFYLTAKAPHAYASIVVNSQPLAKSIPIKVVLGETTSVDGKILKGIKYEVTVTEENTIDTTGEVEEGKKATGEIKITNKKTDEVKLKKGTKLQYSEDDDDLIFVLTSEVTIPAAVIKVEDPVPPATEGKTTTTLGEKTVKVEAEKIGSAYNIDEDDSLRISGYKESELSAKAEDDFKGGSSEKVKVVAEEDTDLVTKDLAPKLIEKSEQLLKEKQTTSSRFISGALKTEIQKSELSAKVGEKADKLTVKQSSISSGLFYSKAELDSLVDNLVDQFIPEGYKLSSKDREVNVEVLGESDNSVLSLEEADLQITLKTYVIPDIDPESLKQELAGKNLNDAKKILGGVRNIMSYDLRLDKSIPIPFFQKIPSNVESITLEVELND
jgi:hypothetical protein